VASGAVAMVTRYRTFRTLFYALHVSLHAVGERTASSALSPFSPESFFSRDAHTASLCWPIAWQSRPINRLPW